MKYDVVIGKKTYVVDIVQKEETFFEVRVDDTLYEVDARRSGAGFWTLLFGHGTHDIDVLSNNGLITMAVDGEAYEADVFDEIRRALRERKGRFDPEGPQELLAPMPGKIVKVHVSPGDEVEEGEGLVIVEAMKMENLLKSQIKGVVKEVCVAEGDAVETKALLVKVEPVKE